MAGSLYYIRNLEAVARELHQLTTVLEGENVDRSKALATFLESFRGPYQRDYALHYSNWQALVERIRVEFHDATDRVKRGWANEVNDYNDAQYEMAVEMMRSNIERLDAIEDQLLNQV